LKDELLLFLRAMFDQTGLAHLWWGNLVMIAIGCVAIYLAIAKRYEPLLLVGIGFSCIISNVPGSDLISRAACSTTPIRASRSSSCRLSSSSASAR
jgi:Na+-transporting methylmalonyl-CoA/oxaloacetate decarboxylase beta subunit